MRVEAREDLFVAATFYEDQQNGLGDPFIDSIFLDLETLQANAGIHEVFHGLRRCGRVSFRSRFVSIRDLLSSD